MIIETVHEDEGNEDLINNLRIAEAKIETENNESQSENYEADWESASENHYLLPKIDTKMYQQRNNHQSVRSIQNVQSLEIGTKDLMKDKYFENNVRKTHLRKGFSNDQLNIKNISGYIDKLSSIKFEDTPIEELKFEAKISNFSLNAFSPIKQIEDQSRTSFEVYTPIDFDDNFPRKKLSFNNYEDIKEEAAEDEKEAEIRQHIDFKVTLFTFSNIKNKSL